MEGVEIEINKADAVPALVEHTVQCGDRPIGINSTRLMIGEINTTKKNCEVLCWYTAHSQAEARGIMVFKH